MKVVLLQMDVCKNDAEENRRRAAQAMAKEPGADLYVLPEMFDTGFCPRTGEGALRPHEETLQWMLHLAARRNCALTGSLAVEEEGHYYNRMYFVEPQGTVTGYNKRHLFTYGGEQRYYVAGKERVTVEFRGFRILLQVCYDLRFPVFSRNRGDYDLAVYVASWPASRSEVWKVLLRARAIENQCYVLGVNRVGSDEAGSYSGDSQVVDAYGRVVAGAEPGKAMQVVAELSMDELQKFRRKFPVLEDGDPFSISF